MKAIIFLFSFLMLSSCSSFKPKSQDSCSDLKECLELASKLTKKSYLYVEKINLDKKINSVGTVTWKEDTADFLIGEVLVGLGYYRLHTKDANIYEIINARDVRYVANVPSYKANKETNDELPAVNSADPVELIYETKNGAKRASEIARNLRPFMSRYGRVIDHDNSGTLVIRDSVATAHKLLALIRQMDVPGTKK